MLSFGYVVVCVTLTTYDKLRRKLQNSIEALSELFAEKSEKMKEKWMNLILCRSPDEQSRKKQGIESDDEDEESKKERPPDKEKNYFEIAMFNLEQIGVSS